MPGVRGFVGRCRDAGREEFGLSDDGGACCGNDKSPGKPVTVSLNL